KQNVFVPPPPPDIYDPLARSGIGAIDQNFGNWRKHDVLRLLPVGPELAARSIPVRSLVGVQLMANRYLHRANWEGVRFSHALLKAPSRQAWAGSRCARCPRD